MVPNLPEYPGTLYFLKNIMDAKGKESRPKGVPLLHPTAAVEALPLDPKGTRCRIAGVEERQKIRTMLFQGFLDLTPPNAVKCIV